MLELFGTALGPRKHRLEAAGDCLSIESFAEGSSITYLGQLPWARPAQVLATLGAHRYLGRAAGFSFQIPSNCGRGPAGSGDERASPSAIIRLTS